MANFAVTMVHGPGWDPARGIRARLGQDPWAAAGLLRIGAMEPWALWLDGRSSSPARSQASR